jgi:ribonuclease III
MAARGSGKSGSGLSPSGTTGSATSSSDDRLASLEAILAHKFSDRSLLKRALSHASIGSESNERLEFLGDRVLGLIVAERLFADHPSETEGGLAVRLNRLVKREACAKVAEAVGLAPFLIMTSAEAASGGRKKGAILSGACEALIAALYLDGGLPAARKFVMHYWNEGFANAAPELRDAKTALQEWTQSGALRDKVQPAYVVTERSGPDHAPNFSIEVRIPGYDPQQGEGPTKRDAEQDAATRMLQRLGVWKE